MIRLKERALEASSEGFSIADVRLPDMPLIYVNSGFERLTGYPAAAVLGTNCRFLQGPGTDRSAAGEIRAALEEKRPCMVEILNYRKDGTPFWNRLAITPVLDESGQMTHFIGVQSDITERKNAEEELNQAKLKLEAANRRMKMELDMAARIQQAMLPPNHQSFDGARISWLFRPCRELAGDTINIIPLNDREVAFYIIDVSGHGVAPALLSVTLSRWLANMDDLSSPPMVARQLNEQFPMASDVPQYFTMQYGVLDRKTGAFRYVSAGHPGPILMRRVSEPVMLSGEGYPIGLLAEVAYEENSVQLQPGDRLVLYTDGLPDAMNADEEQFGTERLKSALCTGQKLNLEESFKNLMSAIEQWHGSDTFDDDITLLALDYS